MRWQEYLMRCRLAPGVLLPSRPEYWLGCGSQRERVDSCCLVDTGDWPVNYVGFGCLVCYGWPFL